MPERLESSFVERGPGMLGDTRQSMRQQRVLVAGPAPGSLGCFRQSAVSRRSDVILLPLSFLVRYLWSSVSSSGFSGGGESGVSPLQGCVGV